MLLAPVAAVPHLAFGRATSVTAAHDEEADRRLVLDAVRYGLEPAIEPWQALGVVDAVAPDRIGSAIDVAGVRIPLHMPLMGPRSHDQPLRLAVLLGHRVVVVHRRGGQGVVPAAAVGSGDVLVAVEVGLAV